MFTPVNKDNFELEKHQEEITNILVKATEPLSELTSLFEINKEYDHDANTFDTTFIESERKYGYLKKAYKYTKQNSCCCKIYETKNCCCCKLCIWSSNRRKFKEKTCIWQLCENNYFHYMCW